MPWTAQAASLSVPGNTSKITSAGEGFLSSYARECFGLTSLDAPDVSNLNICRRGFPMGEGAYALGVLADKTGDSPGGHTEDDV